MSGRRRWWRVDLRAHYYDHAQGRARSYEQQYVVQAESKQNAIAEARRLDSDRTPGAHLVVLHVQEAWSRS